MCYWRTILSQWGYWRSHHTKSNKLDSKGLEKINCLKKWFSNWFIVHHKSSTNWPRISRFILNALSVQDLDIDTFIDFDYQVDISEPTIDLSEVDWKKENSQSQCLAKVIRENSLYELMEQHVVESDSHDTKQVLVSQQPLRENCPYSEFFGPYFPAFGLNTEIYSVSVHIQSEWGKIRTRETPNTNAFHAANWSEKSSQIYGSGSRTNSFKKWPKYAGFCSGSRHTNGKPCDYNV